MSCYVEISVRGLLNPQAIVVVVVVVYLVLLFVVLSFHGKEKEGAVVIVLTGSFPVIYYLQIILPQYLCSFCSQRITSQTCVLIFRGGNHRVKEVFVLVFLHSSITNQTCVPD